MATVRFTKDHEWVSVDGDTATVGVSDYAQQQLGDVVFVELPETGTSLNKGDEAAVVESVKAASELYSPISGEVSEANGALEDEPSLINSSAMGNGWFYKMTVSNTAELDELMDETAYKGYIEGLD
ncbi:MAG: glycine cleavage system protein GcvH [Rhodospirillales bacterium]|nr:glycine cleavage system protein GcvH [Rhodospirillales bacterium]